MFSFLQNVFSRGVRTASDLESNDIPVDEAVSLRDSAGGVSEGYSLSQLRVVSDDRGSSNGNSVPISLRTVVAALPKNLKDAVQTSPDPQMNANIPLPLIATQLPRGSVRITLAELRNHSPKGVFSASPVYDKKRITLPLQEILVHVKVTPRHARKKLNMPDDIPDLFAFDGRAVAGANTGTDDDEVAPMSSALEKVKEREVAPEHGFSDLVELTGDAKRRSLKEPQVTPMEDTNSASTNASGSDSEGSISQSDDADAATVDVAADAGNSALDTSDGIKFSFELSDLKNGEKPEAKAEAARASDSDVIPQLLSTAAETASDQHIEVSLEAIVDVFPNEIKAEVSQAGVETIFEIPLVEIAPKTGCGRIEFSWSQLHSWIKPSLPPTSQGEVKVKLPLKEIIPLFMAEYRPAVGGKRKVFSDVGIPDVFRRGNGSPFHVVKEPGLESDGIVAKEHPRDHLEAAVSLHGVQGAVLVSRDGMVVAERIPDFVDSVALAAFIPEMVGRAADYLSKAHLGVPDWLVLQIEGRMLLISKAGDLYIAVLGETGRPLPRAKLREILHRISIANPAH